MMSDRSTRNVSGSCLTGSNVIKLPVMDAEGYRRSVSQEDMDMAGMATKH